MERKSDHKVRCVCVAIAISLFFVVVVLFTKRNAMISERQLQEMMTIYPEAKQAFEETFSYYDQQRVEVLIEMGICLGTFSFACLLGIYIKKSKQEKTESRIMHQNLQQLQEIITEFQKGAYDVSPDGFEKGGADGGDWTQIVDGLHSLGCQLDSLRERLEQEENSTKALITDISHQLKTPLASLKMSFELSRELSLSQEERAEFLEKEQQEIGRLESLLSELVNLSRLESHMIQVTPSEIDIQKLMTEAMNPVLAKAEKKKLSMHVELSERFTVYADLKWTAQAILNVLDNAIKYSKDGGKILIQIQKLPHIALIEVQDSGIGIAPEELHKIFQRFYRGKEAVKMEQEGAGVGLYLARKILEEQGGTITAKRRTDGTTFRITLPLLRTELRTLTEL